ncbi:unnamed protein product [Ascophyllum nodosum]
MLVSFTLCKVLAVMAVEVWEVVVAVASSRQPEGEDPMEQHLLWARDLAEMIASEKLHPVVAAAATELESWHEMPFVVANDAEDLKAAADQLLTDFDGIQERVGELQESFAKSLSVGSAVGLASLDLEYRVASLRETQGRVVERTKQVHARAHEIVDEHEGYEKIPAVAEGLELERRRQRLREMLASALDNADVQGLRERLQAMERKVNAGVSFQEAEEIVVRIAAAEAERAARKDDKETRQKEPSDQEIERIVKEMMRSMKIPAPSAVPALGGTKQEGDCFSAATARNLTKTELQRFAADRTGMADYAMGPAGATVIFPLTSETYEQPNLTPMEKLRRKIFDAERGPISGPPTAINPVSRLGRCWPMKGSSGQLTVRLSRPIRVSMVSIEHAPRVLLLNAGISAPKTFSVIGYPRGSRLGFDSTGHTLLSGAEYKLEADNIQFFDVAQEYREVEYAAVALHVESNHGNAGYTCLYRFRVHGAPAEAIE